MTKGATGSAMQMDGGRIVFVAHVGRYNTLDDKIIEVRRMLREGALDSEIGAAFGVSKATVTKFIKRRALVRPWKFVRHEDRPRPRP